MTLKKILLLLLSTLLLASCTSEPVQDADFLLNTISTITIYDESSSKKPAEIIDECFSLCRDYENMLSKTIKTSEVSALNSADGKSIEVSEDTAELLNLAVNYSKISDGKFDITISPAADLWNFTAENPKAPTDSEISAAAEKINYKNIEINGTTVTLKGNGTAIDLGGIAKGYIADKAKDFLIENNVKKAIVNLGGNIHVICPEDDETGFKIGIQEPFAPSGTVYGTVKLKNGSVVTSGVYERGFEENGIRYHHILDTKTARPIKNNLYSVTIIAQSSAHADALSTTCFALGLEEGLKLINETDDVEAIFITDDLEYHLSDGVESIYNFTKSE